MVTKTVETPTCFTVEELTEKLKTFPKDAIIVFPRQHGGHYVLNTVNTIEHPVSNRYVQMRRGPQLHKVVIFS